MVPVKEGTVTFPFVFTGPKELKNCALLPKRLKKFPTPLVPEQVGEDDPWKCLAAPLKVHGDSSPCKSNGRNDNSQDSLLYAFVF